MTTRASTAPTIGFLGVGNMGGPMARNMTAAGYAVRVFDPSKPRVNACVRAGADAGSAEDIVDTQDVVFTSLPLSRTFVEVAETLFLPRAREGQVFIDATTTEVAATRRIAVALAERGASLLDAPVSGGPGGSECGALHIFIGGEQAIYERMRPLFELLGDPEHVVYCGPSGAGQITKGVNQLAMGLLNAALMESIAYGVRGGVAPQALVQAVGGEAGFRALFAQMGRRVMEGSADRAYIKLPELPYFTAFAAEEGFRLPLTESILEFCADLPRDQRDNVNRPTLSWWRALMDGHS